MIKELITNDQDRNEAAQLLRRQQYEDDRKVRIFNARERLFGVDKAGLQLQIEEKNKNKSLLRDLEQRYVTDEKTRNAVVYAQMREEEKIKQQIINDLNTYRRRYQRMDQRREFDINDPEWKKKAEPIRGADYDYRLGLGSAQIFDGEDVGFKDRKKLQGAQQRAWLDQQIRDRREANEDRVRADEAYEEAYNSCDKLMGDMFVDYRSQVHENDLAIVEFNRGLAQIKRYKEETRKRENHEDDLAEIYNMVTSDMFTANTEGNQNRGRGMSDKEYAIFLEDQRKQRIEHKQRVLDAKLVDKQWEEYTIHCCNIGILKQLDEDRKEKAIFLENIRRNGELAKEQKARKDHDRATFRNVIYDEFYEQFNRNSR